MLKICKVFLLIRYVFYVISNNGIPDGVYIVLGSVSYPGEKRMSRHVIYQFNLARSRGIDLRWAARFNPYPNVPKVLDLRPIYPMFRIEELTTYEDCKSVYYKLQKTPVFAVDQLKEIIRKADPGSIKDTIYRLRLALQREIEKDRRKY